MSTPDPATAPPAPDEGPIRRTALHERERDAGASFTRFAGWEMPLRFTSDLAEHTAVREKAGLFDLSHMAELLVVGREAGAALDHALASRPSAMPVGRARYSLLLSPEGGVLDDLVVYRTGEDRWLVVGNAANHDVVARELDERIEPFDCVLEDVTDDLALLAVQGPHALGVLVATPGFSIEGGHPDGEDVAETLEALRGYRCVAGSFRSHAVLIARTGYTGEDGFELYVSPEAAGELWDALLEAGRPWGLVPAGLAARDSLRLEAGMPLHGHELSADVRPAQAHLARVLDDTGGDFVGRAAAEAGGEDLPVLVGLAGEGRRAARAGYPVIVDGESVGEVTSGILSPTLGHPIALAFVPPALAAPGTAVEVDVRAVRLPFTVTDLPFYSRER